MTVRKITRVERISDYEQSVRDMLPEWIERCTSALAADYPDAEIVFYLRNNECGPGELLVDCDDDDEWLSASEDIGDIIKKG